MNTDLEREVTVNPRFGRRSWVKLWVNEWLDGTTRVEMTDAQRAFWIDLLAMAGRSRYPGIICAGKAPDGKYIGYPVNKYQSLMSEPINIEETLALFVRTAKITIEVTADSPIRLLTLHLLNWDKFQSEYQRQKPYRQPDKLQPSDSQSYNRSYTKGDITDTETDSDTETEEETPFGVFWDLYPRKIGKPLAEKWWSKATAKEKALVMRGLKLWNQSEQWNRDGGKYIPHASTFLNQKRYLEEAWQGSFEEERQTA